MGLQSSLNARKSCPATQDPKRHHRDSVFKPLFHSLSHLRGSEGVDPNTNSMMDPASNPTFFGLAGIWQCQPWPPTPGSMGATSSPASHLVPRGTFQSSIWCHWSSWAPKTTCPHSCPGLPPLEGRNSVHDIRDNKNVNNLCTWIKWSHALKKSHSCWGFSTGFGPESSALGATAFGCWDLFFYFVSAISGMVNCTFLEQGMSGITCSASPAQQGAEDIPLNPPIYINKDTNHDSKSKTSHTAAQRRPFYLEEGVNSLLILSIHVVLFKQLEVWHKSVAWSNVPGGQFVLLNMPLLDKKKSK